MPGCIAAAQGLAGRQSVADTHSGWWEPGRGSSGRQTPVHMSQPEKGSPWKLPVVLQMIDSRPAVPWPDLQQTSSVPGLGIQSHFVGHEKQFRLVAAGNRRQWEADSGEWYWMEWGPPRWMGQTPGIDLKAVQKAEGMTGL